MTRLATRTGVRLWQVVAIGCCVALLAGCERVEVVTFNYGYEPNIARRYLTRDANDQYHLGTKPGAVRVNAPSSNVGTRGSADTRMVFWPEQPKPTQDQQSCATWTDAVGAWSQQGIALRIRTDGTRFRSIVVAKNVLYGAGWQFHVDTWDTARSSDLMHHGAVQLTTPFKQGTAPAPLPWKVCARVEGTTVTVKGWRASQSEPAWTNAAYTGTVTLPASWVYNGRAGWYAGHVPPGGTIGMNQLRTSTWRLDTDR